MDCFMEQNNRKKATQTKNILIRCSPEQHEKIFTNASLNKLNVSQYILKKSLNEDFRNETDHELISTLIQMKADLARLGNLFKLCIDQHDLISIVDRKGPDDTAGLIINLIADIALSAPVLHAEL